MANDNTILSVLGATAKASTTVAQAFFNSAGNQISLSVPNNWNLNCLPFVVRMIGNVTNLNATSVTIQPALYVGVTTVTSNTTGTNVAMCIPTAVSSNIASQLSMNFILEATCLWDSVTSSIVPSFNFSAGPAGSGYKVYAAGTYVSGVTQGNAGTTGINLVPYITLSASSTNNAVTLTEFSISQI